MSGNGKNEYLLRREARDKAFLDVGIDSGAQRIMDYLQCVLHDPKVMGKDVFGPKRLRKVIQAIDERDKYYAPAYTTKNNADKLQDELDQELKEIWGDEALKFTERQPYIKQPEYNKAFKGWK